MGGDIPAALAVTCSAACADLVLGLLWEAGTTGVEEVSATELRAYFKALPEAGFLRRLRSAGAVVRHETVPDRDWVAASRSRVRPVRVAWLLVRPPWSRARPRPGEELLVIDPARAFGTGSHESTRLVLAEILSRRPLAGRMLDVGCGTGILALAALRAGARLAVAVDMDPEATRAAGENAARNALADRLVVRLGGPDSVPGRFPLVVANLTAPLLAALAEDIATRVAVGGALVLSGFLANDEAGLDARYQGLGLQASGRRQESEWVALALSRPRARLRGGAL